MSRSEERRDGQLARVRERLRRPPRSPSEEDPLNRTVYGLSHGLPPPGSYLVPPLDASVSFSGANAQSDPLPYAETARAEPPSTWPPPNLLHRTWPPSVRNPSSQRATGWRQNERLHRGCEAIADAIVGDSQGHRQDHGTGVPRAYSAEATAREPLAHGTAPRDLDLSDEVLFTRPLITPGDSFNSDSSDVPLPLRPREAPRPPTVSPAEGDPSDDGAEAPPGCRQQ